MLALSGKGILNKGTVLLPAMMVKRGTVAHLTLISLLKMARGLKVYGSSPLI